MYTDVIKEFRDAGARMHVARSTLEAIIMLTDKMIEILRHRFIGTEPTFEDYQAAIERHPRPPARLRSRKALRGKLTF